MAGGSKSTACLKRLMADLKKLEDDAPAGVSGCPREENIKIWDAIIFGLVFFTVDDCPVPIIVCSPSGTPWDGGMFKLTVEFREDYPNTPPNVSFVSNMFHPNVYDDGAICLDILQKQWCPAYDVAAVLTSIRSLLCDPNPNSPANPDAAKLYSNDPKEYKRRVHQVVEESLSNV